MMRKLFVLALLPALVLSASGLARANDRIVAAAERIEKQLDARVGLAIYAPADGSWWLYNADQRFPMASTFKVLACAALLASDVADSPTMLVQELQDYSPATKDMVGQLVSPYQLCDATMRTSDNTAANLVLDAIGGPPAVTQFVRGLGDETTRLDRMEPDLNEGTPGDPRDTTTPQAIARTLHVLILGDALPAPKRSVLTGWMRSNEGGGPLLRAGVPQDWIVADRTGAGSNGTRGVVAVLWPAEAPPIVAAIFITQTTASMELRNAAIAALGRAITDAVAAR